MTIAQLRSIRNMKMHERARTLHPLRTQTDTPSTTTFLNVKVGSVWKWVFIPGIDSPDDPDVYIP